MQIDNTTLNDLSIFNAEEEYSIFQKLDFTQTIGGRQKLKNIFDHPLSSLVEIIEVQNTLRIIQKNNHLWTKRISNGTIMVIHKFYETAIDEIPAHPGVAAALNYKLFHSADFSLVKYSVTHCCELIKGMWELIELLMIKFPAKKLPAPLISFLEKAKKNINNEQISILLKVENCEQLTASELLELASFIKYKYKQTLLELVELYYLLDAWHSMAIAADEYDLAFPVFDKSEEPVIEASGLYHLLLSNPVNYNVSLRQNNNFIFLTGANMAGKSTFIKSVGTAVFLAHIGMPVPAIQMKLSLFDGLLSNINITDNIAKGESYFYNEVQNIKNTLLKINDGNKWLVLIDELFKGTNVLDAMKCSTAVIRGLLKIKNSLFILSTHLYEIGEELKESPNISFKYFETNVEDEKLNFSYQLKDGISNDRLGYLILKREGVIELLEKL